MQGDIINVYYKRVGFSDHSLLFFMLDYTSVERGGGVWPLNAMVLKSNVLYIRRVLNGFWKKVKLI